MTTQTQREPVHIARISIGCSAAPNKDRQWIFIQLKHTKLQCAFTHAASQTPRDGRGETERQREKGERVESEP